MIAYSNGAPVRVQDVATIVDGVENTQQAAWMNTMPAVIVNIQRQPGANIINVVDRIKALLPQLKLPADRRSSPVLTDRTTTIRASVKDVQFELMLTVALVVLVIFIFLRVWGDDHPERGRAAFVRRHFWSDVPAGLQPQQFDPDGAHHLDRIRRGRRHRDDREYLALSSKKENPPLQAASKARNKSVSLSSR